MVSYLSHVGIVLNPFNGKVLESYVERGVSSYSYEAKWDEGLVFVRRKVDLDQASIEDAVDMAESLYADRTPYFPQGMDKTVLGVSDAIVSFFNKNNSESMYCSDLVWNTFMLKNIDLDSNMIISFSVPASVISAVAVLPDEIYFSPYLKSERYNKVPF